MIKLEKIETLSKSAKIEDIIRGKIKNGELKPGKCLPPEVFWAAKLGVHRLTVNKAMSNLVRDGLLFRVHGRGTFVKNHSDMKTVVPLDTQTVSIFFVGEFSNASNEYFFYGYQALCSLLGKSRIIIKTETFKTFEECAPPAESNAVVVFTFNDVSREDLRVFSKRKIPVILFNRYLEGDEETLSVIADNRGMTEKVTRLLLDEGHRDILYVRYNNDSSVSRDRLAGYRNAIASYGAGREYLVNSAGCRGPAIYEAIKTISPLLQSRKFSAVICENLYMLWGMKSFLEENRIPGRENMVFACLDNWGSIPVAIPELRYSVEYPLAEMGRITGQLFLDIIGGRAITNNIIKVPGHIISGGI
ncbi:MAG: GntR family transcriptional regulator [Victivallaceae bacterium]|nr:GntR family transcriptional regulator [Victivallaceae bacterium]